MTAVLELDEIVRIADSVRAGQRRSRLEYMRGLDVGFAAPHPSIDRHRARRPAGTARRTSAVRPTASPTFRSIGIPLVYDLMEGCRHGGLG
jgi:hypothetical protein